MNVIATIPESKEEAPRDEDMQSFVNRSLSQLYTPRVIYDPRASLVRELKEGIDKLQRMCKEAFSGGHKALESGNVALASKAFYNYRFGLEVEAQYRAKLEEIQPKVNTAYCVYSVAPVQVH